MVECGVEGVGEPRVLDRNSRAAEAKGVPDEIGPGIVQREKQLQEDRNVAEQERRQRQVPDDPGSPQRRPGTQPRTHPSEQDAQQYESDLNRAYPSDDVAHEPPVGVQEGERHFVQQGAKREIHARENEQQQAEAGSRRSAPQAWPILYRIGVAVS